MTRFLSNVRFGDIAGKGKFSDDFLGVVVKALPLMGSVLPLLVGVLTVLLLCCNFGLLSSLDDVDEGEFECLKESDDFSTTGLEEAAVVTSKAQIVHASIHHLMYKHY